MPRLGDIWPGRGVTDWNQWLIKMLHEWMDRVRNGRLMIENLQPISVIECGISSRRSCESIQVIDMTKSSKPLPAQMFWNDSSQER
jgi:hypothetical protein